MEKVQKITDDKIIEEQGSFRTRRGCIGEIFSMRMTTEKIPIIEGKEIVCCIHRPGEGI